jgi:hypothetical protein
MRTILGAFALVLGAHSLDAQLNSTLSSPIPAWADSALTRAGVWGRYDLSSRLNPEIRFGDLDGDGLSDVVVAVVDKSARRRGLVVVHRADRSVHVLGAGTTVTNGPDALPTDWSIGRLKHHREGLRVVGWHVSAWIVWNGHDYAWVPDAN